MKSKHWQLYSIGALSAVVITALTYMLQMYRLTSLEEEYILLYDSDYIVAEIAKPGGVAQLLSSWCTQFFICRFAGPLITGIIYGIIITSLIKISTIRRSPLYIAALSAAPALCLMLCLENTAFEYQGITAVMINVTSVLGYVCLSDRISAPKRTILGSVMTVILYWISGSASVLFAVCAALYDLAGKKPKAFLALIYPILWYATAMAFYLTEAIPTIAEALTPAMYYDMGSTYFMMLYSMCAVVIYLIAVMLTSYTKGPKSKISLALSLIIICVEVGIALNIYGTVHSRSNYENQQQRFYARHGMWDEILEMPYDGAPTPYTSYRFLALAQTGRLDKEINQYRPFISYIFENKPKVKKRDQQVYSDIYYACQYMAAARRSAFDTDIVTPGAFNPYETQKLAAINIAYGDYGVAEKLLNKLEKTRYYSDWAREHRKYLYNDSAVEADPVLGAMRKAIPQTNYYLSPKGIQRDLENIITVIPDQETARQFYSAFMILTNQLQTPKPEELDKLDKLDKH